MRRDRRAALHVAPAIRGYPDEEIAAIVGGNYLRLLREVCG